MVTLPHTPGLPGVRNGRTLTSPSNCPAPIAGQAERQVGADKAGKAGLSTTAPDRAGTASRDGGALGQVQGRSAHGPVLQHRAPPSPTRCGLLFLPSRGQSLPTAEAALPTPPQPLVPGPSACPPSRPAGLGSSGLTSPLVTPLPPGTPTWPATWSPASPSSVRLARSSVLGLCDYPASKSPSFSHTFPCPRDHLGAIGPAALPLSLSLC